jgi:ATP-dependent protease ClpP protease subunit
MAANATLRVCDEMWQGMTLVPAVTELILAELLYLQYENADKPITMYINSTGTSKVRVHSGVRWLWARAVLRVLLVRR